MKDQIAKALEPLIGQAVWYCKQQTEIKSYEMDDERERVFIYFSNRGRLDRPYESALHLIDQFTTVAPIITVEEVPSHLAPSIHPAILPMVSNAEILNKATEMLFKDAEALVTGELDINIAETRLQNIDKIIEIEKTKIAAAAVIAKLVGK